MNNLRKLFTGSSNPALANEIADYLQQPLGRVTIQRFADGEIYVEIGENIRNADVYLIQSTCAPVNDHLMELLVMVDTCKRASANSITLVLPYYGYARQDRKVAPRTPITAKLVADLLSAAGADRVVAMDLHAGQIQGFFSTPVDHIYAMPVFLRDIKERFSGKDLIIVSPDAGGVERVRMYSKRLECPIAVIDKRRERANVVESMNVVGDVRGKVAVLVDDMIDTGGTICQAAQALLDQGAIEVAAYTTHPVFSGPAIDRLSKSVLSHVVCGNTIPLPAAARDVKKITQLSVAPMLGEAISRIHAGESVSALFV
jgi:ribose-phosphate pyrophosphokinase